MKKQLLTLVVFILSLSFITAQDTIVLNVSGHIMDIETGIPIDNHPLNIDIVGAGYTQTYEFFTNDDGFYSADIFPGITQGEIIASTFDCEYAEHTQAAYFSPNALNFNFDFEICADSINPPWDCIANFSYVYDSVPGDPMVFFTDLSEGNPQSWFWEFGDGSTSFEQNPVHAYVEPGVYEVCLTIGNNNPANPCEDTFCDVLDLNGGIADCVNWFDFNVDPNGLVSFYAYSEPEAIEYVWDFGDGISGEGQNVTHFYDPSMGDVFLVSLMTLSVDSITNEFCEAVSVQEVFIGNGGSGDCECFFDYVSLPGQIVDFFGNLIPENENTIYSWDFGDGNFGEGQFVEHFYEEQGWYLVTLEAVSPDSCADVYSAEVFVEPNGGNDCENFFWYETDDLYNFMFFGETYMYPAENFYWDFGDGITAEGQSVEHNYNVEPGIYTVTLTTIAYMPGIDSCIAVSYQDVLVGENGFTGCENWFFFDQVEENTFSFCGEMMEPQDAEFYWDFGDGETDFGPCVVHTFDPSAGDAFVVCLTTTVLYGDSCSYTSCQDVLIGGNIFGDIHGTIFIDENTNADYAVVGLFGMDENGSFVYDMVLTDPYTGFYHFENVVDDDYYVIASLVPGSEYFGLFFPTYFESALYWWNADLVSPGETLNPYDIQLIQTENMMSGIAEINGSVSMEGKGDGLNSVNVIIMDENQQAIHYTATDGEGNFDFQNLAFGTYHLKVDIPGVESELVMISLTEETTNANVEFYYGNGQIYLDAEESLTSGIEMSIFPNPVLNDANIEIHIEQSDNLNYAVYNSMGQLILSDIITLQSGQNRIEIPSSAWPSGLYQVQLNTASWKKKLKFIK